jgi:membrane-anchored glycerophosphoryl diester phosphodiesterase (GDPDase)
MSPISTGGKAAAGVVTALGDQPLVLALIVVCLMLAGLLYYQSAIFSAQRQANVALFVDVQKETQKLLSQCIIPAPQKDRAEAPSFLN